MVHSRIKKVKISIKFNEDIRLPLQVKNKDVIEIFKYKTHNIIANIIANNLYTKDDIINECFNLAYDTYGRTFITSLEEFNVIS